MVIKLRNPFLPYIADFEKEVENFLKAYGYERLIINPAPIPIKEIIKNKMMLEIVDTEYLSPNFEIHGIISFSNGIVEVYDFNESEYVGYEIKEPTILIDASYTNERYINRILAHEAYHWYKHKKYYIYQKNHNLSDEFAFRCNRINESNESEPSWTDYQIMEWQAKKIAHMILLPKKSVLLKVKELTGQDDNINLSEEEIITLINTLADFYNVTSYTMKIRLEELGLIALNDEGKFIETNNQIINNVQRVGSADISLIEGFELFKKDETFRKYLESGLFAFENNKFIHRYKTKTTNNCLLFNTKLILLDQSDDLNRLMFKKEQQFRKEKALSKQPQNMDYYTDVEKHVKKFKEEHERKAKRYKSPNDQLVEYMQDAKWNTAIFQDRTLLSSMDFTRIHKSDHKFKLPHYVAIAVGLGLSYAEFELVLNSAGIKLVSGDPEHDAYAYVLTALQGKGIDVCNDFLEQVGINRLGTKTKDWKDMTY